MNEYVLAFMLFGSALFILMSGIPIWAGLAGTAIIFILFFSPHLLSMMPYVLYGSVDNFALLAVPLFILLSAPIAKTNASRDLYETLHKWLYKIPCGLGVASMVGCGIFAALCGSSPATAAAIGGIAIPEMRKRGYSSALATGLIAHSGTFGILIPPSITMILYGVVTETLCDLLSICKIDTALSFQEAERLLAENEYDIAVLDIMGVNGFTLLELSVKKEIPVLMLTAHGLSEENLDTSMRKGASYYAPKEEMHRIDIFVADVLRAAEKGKNPWTRWLERLGNFYDKRFGGRDWREKERQFWKQRTKSFD